MRKKACCLVAALFVTVSASCCLATASRIETTQHNVLNAYSHAYAHFNSELDRRQMTNADGQTDRYFRATSSPEAVSGRTLEFQSASPRSRAQSSAPSTTGNTTRIIVPISRVDNASNIGPASSKGFAFPTWLLILAAILVLLAVFGLLFLRLIREDDRRPTVDAPAVLVVKPAAPARAKRPQQIPIKAERAQAERRNNAAAIARPRRLRRIRIDTKEEQDLEDGFR